MNLAHPFDRQFTYYGVQSHPSSPIGKFGLTPVGTFPSKVFPSVWHQDHRQDQLQLLQAFLPFFLSIRLFFFLVVVYIITWSRVWERVDLVIRAGGRRRVVRYWFYVFGVGGHCGKAAERSKLGLELLPCV